MTEREALKLALEALEFIPKSGSMLGAQAEAKRLEAITAIKEALAQPKPEYLAFMDTPQRTWVGLTFDERLELAEDVDWPAGAYCEYAEKIEAKLKEKNT